MFYITEIFEELSRKKHRINQETYRKILGSLGRFSDKEDIDIYSIPGLEKLDLKSSDVWSANAKIVFKYLQGIRRKNLIVVYNLTSIS